MTFFSSRILYPWIRKLHFFFKQATSDKKDVMKELLSPFRLLAVRHTQHSMALFCAVYATHVVSQNILL